MLTEILIIFFTVLFLIFLHLKFKKTKRSKQITFSEILTKTISQHADLAAKSLNTNNAFLSKLREKTQKNDGA